uniref:Elongation of very long chain fatty acids protein n=1 Tax=Ciona savignyi TaxID=51511 RepID=H2Z286_CIOSA
MVCTGPIVERLIHPNWTYAFLYSKFLEYGDTVFIVFRKKPLIFLHWYHHLTVALFCWFNVQNNYAGSCIFMGLNAVIHAFMYTYYSLKAAEFKIPRVVSISITLFQIVQMLLGCSFMTYIIVMGNDSDCKTSNSHSLAGGFMYASYLVLFAQFFQRSYSSQTSSQKHSTLSEAAKLEHTDGATQSDGSVRQRRL